MAAYSQAASRMKRLLQRPEMRDDRVRVVSQPVVVEIENDMFLKLTKGPKLSIEVGTQSVNSV